MVHALFDACARMRAKAPGCHAASSWTIRSVARLPYRPPSSILRFRFRPKSSSAAAATDVIPRQFDQGSQIEKPRGTDRHSDSLGFRASCFPSFVHASAARYRTLGSALEWMHRKCAEYDGRDDGQRAIGRDQLNGRSYPNATLKGPSMFRRKIAHGRSPTSCRPKQISPCLGCKTP